MTRTVTNEYGEIEFKEILADHDGLFVELLSEKPIAVCSRKEATEAIRQFMASAKLLPFERLMTKDPVFQGGFREVASANELEKKLLANSPTSGKREYYSTRSRDQYRYKSAVLPDKGTLQNNPSCLDQISLGDQGMWLNDISPRKGWFKSGYDYSYLSADGRTILSTKDPEEKKGVHAKLTLYLTSETISCCKPYL